MKYLAFILLTIISHTIYPIGSDNNQGIGKIFIDFGFEGTFVLFDINKNSYTIHNIERAEKRYIPASTFKIPNTLIGLQVKAVENVDEVLPFGGKDQPIKLWEQEMSLRDAIKISNVPIYQSLPAVQA